MSGPDALSYDPNQVAALADRHYIHLLEAGEQGLTFNPLVDLSAPAQGRVLWGNNESLEGYDVTNITREGLFSQDQDNFERIGFSPEMQLEGIWVLKGLRYEFDHEKSEWRESAKPGHTFAHYDTTNNKWQVVRSKDDNPDRSDWVNQWQPMNDDFSTEERAIVGRIAQETEMLADAAVTLQEQYMAYVALEQVLTRRAQESGNPRDVARIGAIVSPYSFIGTSTAYQFRVSGFAELQSQAIPLYRALAGKEQRDSTGIQAVATAIAAPGHLAMYDTRIGDATLCPPYEAVEYGLER
jgi:hypothetical protein